MSDLFYAMQKEKAVVQPTPKPEPVTIWLVAAWSKSNGFSIRRANSFEEYKTRDAAEKAASELSDKWTHRWVVPIELKPE